MKKIPLILMLFTLVFVLIWNSYVDYSSYWFIILALISLVVYESHRYFNHQLIHFITRGIEIVFLTFSVFLLYLTYPDLANTLDQIMYNGIFLLTSFANIISIYLFVKLFA